MSTTVDRSRPRGFFEVAVGMIAGFGGKSDQMSSEGGPGGFGRQARDVLVNVVKVGDGLSSDGLFGRQGWRRSNTSQPTSVPGPGGIR